MTEHSNALYDVVAGQVRDLQGRDVSDESIELMLDAITVAAAQTIPGAAFAGITLVQHADVVSIAPTDPIVSEIDNIQLRHRSGPAHEAVWQHGLVRIDDYGTDQRWSPFVADVVALTAIRSSMWLQLYRDDTLMTALTLHAERPHAFDAGAQTRGQAFARQVSLALHSGNRDQQFRQALGSRDEIGQAKGILMERYSIDARQAFEMLRTISQDTNTKVADLSHRLVTLDHPAPDTNSGGISADRSEMSLENPVPVAQGKTETVESPGDSTRLERVEERG